MPALLHFTFTRRRLISKGATIAADACIGNATITGRPNLLSVGSGTFIGRVSLMLHAPVQIGSNVCMNDDVTILTATHDLTDPFWRVLSQPVVIEEYAWVATGATILPGVRIGRGAVIGANAVVAKSVPPNVVMIGNPARPVGTSRTDDLRYNPTAFLAFREAWLGVPKAEQG
jgi:maltose O-acetyltransferase